jgi:hypothetical protein
MVDFIPRYTRANVLRGQAALWLAPFSATTPVPLPGNTLALGGDWATPVTGNILWKPVGATETGVTMRFTRETTDITIEEQVNPVDVATNTLDPRIEAVLSEDTLETMTTAYGGGSIQTTAAAAGQPGISTLTVSSELTHLTLGMEAQNNKGFWRRVLFPDVLSVAEVETSYRRAETQRLYAVSFRMVNPLSELIIREMTAAALP